MIETISLLGNLIVAIVVATYDVYQLFDKLLQLASIAANCISCLAFSRLYMQVYRDRSKPIRTRNHYLCLVYLFFQMYLILHTLACLTDSKFKFYVMIYISVLNIVAFIVVKIKAFQKAYTHGSVYKFLHIIDAVVLFMLHFVVVYSSTVQSKLQISLILIVFGLCILSWILNRICVRFEPYWQHKKFFIDSVLQLLRENRDVELIEPVKKDITYNTIAKELMQVLNYAPNRLSEVSRIVKLVYRLLLSEGRSSIVANEIAAGYARVIIINLMKRQADFSSLPVKLANRVYGKKVQLNKRTEMLF